MSKDNQVDFKNYQVPRTSINQAQPSEWDEVASQLWVKPADPNVEKVVDSYLSRAKQGMTKYGKTTSQNPLELVQWMRHLQEELMDATIYIERAIEELSK